MLAVRAGLAPHFRVRSALEKAASPPPGVGASRNEKGRGEPRPSQMFGPEPYSAAAMAGVLAAGLPRRSTRASYSAHSALGRRSPNFS
jgi:hypothetical protein